MATASKIMLAVLLAEAVRDRYRDRGGPPAGMDVIALEASIYRPLLNPGACSLASITLPQSPNA